MSAFPLVSIIIPVYNVASYLRACVDSVLRQTYPHMEIVLVDDGSSDESPAICDAYAAGDLRVQALHQLNAGVSAARNAGTLAANGEYIAYLDSDDYWELDSALEEMVKIAVSEHPDIILFAYRKQNLVNGNNTPFRLDSIPPAQNVTELKMELLRQRKYSNSPWSKFIRKQFILEHGISFPVGKKSEDLAWSRRILTEAATISIYPNSVLVYQTARSGSATNTFSSKHFYDILQQLEADIAAIRLDPALENRKIGYAFWAQELCWILAYPPFLGREQFRASVSDVKPYLFILKYGISKRVILLRLLIAFLGIRGSMRALNLFLRKKGVIGLA